MTGDPKVLAVLLRSIPGKLIPALFFTLSHDGEDLDGLFPFSLTGCLVLQYFLIFYEEGEDK